MCYPDTIFVDNEKEGSHFWKVKLTAQKMMRQIKGMTIQCSKCGTSNDDESIYCGSCGAFLSSSHGSPSTPDQASELMTSASVGSPHISNRNIVIAVCAFIIVVLIVFTLISAEGSGPSAAQTQTQNIVSGSLTVDQRGSRYYQFTVPIGSTSAQVKGIFNATAEGGSGIQVYVMDNVNLFIWANSRGDANVSANYKSGQVTADRIDVRLSPGTYYLIFDNTSNSSKDVQANVSLTYNS